MGNTKAKTVNKKNLSHFKAMIDKMNAEKVELDRVSKRLLFW